MSGRERRLGQQPLRASFGNAPGGRGRREPIEFPARPGAREIFVFLQPPLPGALLARGAGRAAPRGGQNPGHSLCGRADAPGREGALGANAALWAEEGAAIRPGKKAGFIGGAAVPFSPLCPGFAVNGQLQRPGGQRGGAAAGAPSWDGEFDSRKERSVLPC